MSCFFNSGISKQPSLRVIFMLVTMDAVTALCITTREVFLMYMSGVFCKAKN